MQSDTIRVGYGDRRLVSNNPIARFGAYWYDKSDEGIGMFFMPLIVGIILSLPFAGTIGSITNSAPGSTSFVASVVGLVVTSLVFLTFFIPSLCTLYARVTSKTISMDAYEIGRVRKLYRDADKHERGIIENLYRSMLACVESDEVREAMQRVKMIDTVHSRLSMERKQSRDDSDLRAAQQFLEMLDT